MGFCEVFGVLAPILGRSAILIIPLLIFVAYLTFIERKVIAFMQLRVGPSIAGPFGLLQPLADAIKLLTKELISPTVSDKPVFLAAPIITFVTAMIGWAVIPISNTFYIANINLGVLYLLAVSSIAVYGVILAGLASNSMYAVIGAIRSAAQMISYEIAMSCCVVGAILLYGSANLLEIVHAQQTLPWWSQLFLAPMGIIFFISILAETNRHPFDLPEAESELVAGYHVEYSSMGFALFFLGEYANMILMSAVTTILFLGAWLPPFNIDLLAFIHPFIWFVLKISFCLFVFIWVRASLPRYRYDQLMRIGWKLFIPFTFIWLYVIAIVRIFST